MAPLPVAPLSFVLGRVARGVARRRSGLFVRLGHHATKRFLIDPIDLPSALLLCPLSDDPKLYVVRRGDRVEHDCRIAGPLATLLAMIHGAQDGDALFFSRDIVIEGDTEAALALRNALDDAELDLFAEIAAIFGQQGTSLAGALRPGLLAVSRLTGVALTRIEAGA